VICLPRAVARTRWAELLPACRAEGPDQPVGGPTYVDALPLGAGTWLAVLVDGVGRNYAVPLVVTAGGVRRARPGDGAAEALLALFAGGSRPLGAFSVTAWHTEPCSGEWSIDVGQVNECIVVGGRAVLKWTVLAASGPHPVLSVLTELEQHNFAGTPRPWGLVEWRKDDQAPALLASVTELLPGAIDGWTWAVDDLRQAVNSRDHHVVVEAGRRLGALIADFHTALAGTAMPAAQHEVAEWQAAAWAELDQALSVTNGVAHEVLDAHASAVRRAWANLGCDPRGPVMRIHGDLHVGQVLRAAGVHEPTYVVTDFDGNPILTAAEGIRLQPAALDVAGMAQSLAHVGLVLARAEVEHDLIVVARMAGVLVSAFLHTYRTSLAAAGNGHLLDPALVRPFRLRQICREFSYSAMHSPRWSYVPEGALPALVLEGGSS
jgi:maltokinase